MTFLIATLPHATQGMNIHIPGTYGLKGLADGPRDGSGSKFVNQETMLELLNWMLGTCEKGGLEG